MKLWVVMVVTYELMTATCYLLEFKTWFKVLKFYRVHYKSQTLWGTLTAQRKPSPTQPRCCQHPSRSLSPGYMYSHLDVAPVGFWFRVEGWT